MRGYLRRRHQRAWQGRRIGLEGGMPADRNHAKVGVSATGRANYTIFGDMNQQGAISGRCERSQNGRGGLFFVIDNASLNGSVADLIAGNSAPTADAVEPATPGVQP